MYTHEFGPLLSAWVRVTHRPISEFWLALPWEVAAVLGVGPYKVEGTKQGRGGGHPRDQKELLRARVRHARNPGANPKPVPLKDTNPSNLISGLGN